MSVRERTYIASKKIPLRKKEENFRPKQMMSVERKRQRDEAEVQRQHNKSLLLKMQLASLTPAAPLAALDSIVRMGQLEHPQILVEEFN